MEAVHSSQVLLTITVLYDVTSRRLQLAFTDAIIPNVTTLKRYDFVLHIALSSRLVCLDIGPEKGRFLFSFTPTKPSSLQPT
jgi:hypothetical protein